MAQCNVRCYSSFGDLAATVRKRAPHRSVYDSAIGQQAAITVFVNGYQIRRITTRSNGTVTVACLLAVPPGFSVPYQPGAVTPSARVVPYVNGQPFSIQLTDARSVERTVHSIANSMSAPVGIEYVEAGPPSRNRVVGANVPWSPAGD
jgi:hypothetical protein